MHIETERLLMRPWKEEDLAPLAKLYSDLRVMEFWEIRSLEDTKKDYTLLSSPFKKLVLYRLNHQEWHKLRSIKDKN